jgi:hypothetical protein
MNAECAAQLENMAVATAMVNRVRDRMKNNPAEWLHKYKAGTTDFDPAVLAANYKIGDYPVFKDKAFALKAIYFERKLELAEEGHRFFDLSRWGIADQVLNAFYAYEVGVAKIPDLTGAQFTKGKNEYFPIPQRQIDLTLDGSTRLLTQNPGY